MRALFCFLTALCFFVTSLIADGIRKDYFSHPSDPMQKIEVVTKMPKGENFPLLLLLHGASMKNGANDFSLSVFQFWNDKGIAVVAVSLPGFGMTDGLNDFCGPYTMQALNAVIDNLKKQISFTSIGVIGFGIGGLAATLLSSQRDDLCCVVSVNGGYDLSRLTDENDAIRKVLENNKTAIEFTPSEICMRSPFERASTIRCPLFLLHRRLNPIVTLNEVVLFSKIVESSGGDCTTVFLNGGDTDQKISSMEVAEIAGNWIEQHLQKVE